MEENRIYYVGIDHGNHLMKTSNHVFENGVERQAVKPTFQANTLVYDGAFYKIGEKRNSVKDSKLADDDYYLLTLAALAKECQAGSIPNGARVVLGVGLPLKQFMTNEFPAGSGKKTYAQCVFIEKEGNDYKPTKTFLEMLSNKDFYNIIKELVDFGISRYERDYKQSYDVTDFVLYQKYTYEDVCRLLNWEQNEVPLNIGGYKYDKKTKTFPVFINYDKSDDISDTTKYEDHFEQGFRDRLIAISKSGRSLQSEDVQNFLKAKERGIRVELFVRKNKDDKISKEFYYLGHMTASGNTKEFTMPNTQKTAVEIEWILDVPVREDIYEYIVNS